MCGQRTCRHWSAAVQWREGGTKEWAQSALRRGIDRIHGWYDLVHHTYVTESNKLSKNLCTGRFADGAEFLRGKVNVTPASWDSGAAKSAATVALMPLLIFCCVHRSTNNVFQWAGQPPNITHFPWGIWTPSNAWFLGPTRIYPPIGISIGTEVFAGLTNVHTQTTNTHTDHATPSVVTERI